MDERARRRLGLALRLTVALAGVGLTAWVVHAEGPSTIAQAARGALPVLPIVLLLEVGRLVLEALASRAALGPSGAALPFSSLLHAQAIAHAVLSVAPAARPSAELTKAALLSGSLGGPEVAGAAAIMQAATFVAVGSVSLVCGVATLSRTGPGLLVWLLLGNATLLLALGVGLRALLRAERPYRFLRAKLPARAALLERFRESARGGERGAARPASFLLLAMLCQVLQLRVLAGAITGSGSVSGALAAQGVHLVTASLAVFVPGQLGAREVAFSMAADALGTTKAQAATMALLAHASQLALALVGFALLLAWRRAASARRDA